jgi:hypothetical protein
LWKYQIFKRYVANERKREKRRGEDRREERERTRIMRERRE